jgi:hypothetical protein
MGVARSSLIRSVLKEEVWSWCAFGVRKPPRPSPNLMNPTARQASLGAPCLAAPTVVLCLVKARA